MNNKLNITIDLEDYKCYDYCGNGAKDFISDIMDRIARHILETSGVDYGDLDAMLNEQVSLIASRMESKLEDKLVAMLKKEYLANIADNIVVKLEGLYEKSKAYREAKQGLGIEQDRMISSGLRSMVKDVVAEEVRKMIRV